MIDTHTYIKNYVSAKNAEEQAEATASIIKTIFEEREEIYKRNLASKQDLKELELRLVNWFAAMLLAQGGLIVAFNTLLN